MVEVRTIEVAETFLGIYAPSFVIALRINKKLNTTRTSVRPRRLLRLKRARLRKRRESAGYEKVGIIKCSKKKLAVGARRRWWGRSW